MQVWIYKYSGIQTVLQAIVIGQMGQLIGQILLQILPGRQRTQISDITQFLNFSMEFLSFKLNIMVLSLFI